MIRIPRRPTTDVGRKPRFTEGLIAGALIGAAIAGSALWSRVRDARASRNAAGPQPPSPVPADDRATADGEP